MFMGSVLDNAPRLIVGMDLRIPGARQFGPPQITMGQLRDMTFDPVGYAFGRKKPGPPAGPLRSRESS